MINFFFNLPQILNMKRQYKYSFSTFLFGSLFCLSFLILRSQQACDSDHLSPSSTEAEIIELPQKSPIILVSDDVSPQLPTKSVPKVPSHGPSDLSTDIEKKLLPLPEPLPPAKRCSHFEIETACRICNWKKYKFKNVLVTNSEFKQIEQAKSPNSDVPRCEEHCSLTEKEKKHDGIKRSNNSKDKAKFSEKEKKESAHVNNSDQLEYTKKDDQRLELIGNAEFFEPSENIIEREKEKEHERKEKDEIDDEDESNEGNEEVGDEDNEEEQVSIPKSKIKLIDRVDVEAPKKDGKADSGLLQSLERRLLDMANFRFYIRTEKTSEAVAILEKAPDRGEVYLECMISLFWRYYLDNPYSEMDPRLFVENKFIPDEKFVSDVIESLILNQPDEKILVRAFKILKKYHLNILSLSKTAFGKLLDRINVSLYSDVFWICFQMAVEHTKMTNCFEYGSSSTLFSESVAVAKFFPDQFMDWLHELKHFDPVFIFERHAEALSCIIATFSSFSWLNNVHNSVRIYFQMNRDHLGFHYLQIFKDISKKIVRLNDVVGFFSSTESIIYYMYYVLMRFRKKIDPLNSPVITNPQIQHNARLVLNHIEYLIFIDKTCIDTSRWPIFDPRQSKIFDNYLFHLLYSVIWPYSIFDSVLTTLKTFQTTSLLAGVIYEFLGDTFFYRDTPLFKHLSSSSKDYMTKIRSRHHSTIGSLFRQKIDLENPLENYYWIFHSSSNGLKLLSGYLHFLAAKADENHDAIRLTIEALKPSVKLDFLGSTWIFFLKEAVEAFRSKSMPEVAVSVIISFMNHATSDNDEVKQIVKPLMTELEEYKTLKSFDSFYAFMEKMKVLFEKKGEMFERKMHKNGNGMLGVLYMESDDDRIRERYHLALPDLEPPPPSSPVLVKPTLHVSSPVIEMSGSPFITVPDSDPGATSPFTPDFSPGADHKNAIEASPKTEFVDESDLEEDIEMKQNCIDGSTTGTETESEIVPASSSEFQSRSIPKRSQSSSSLIISRKKKRRNDSDKENYKSPLASSGGSASFSGIGKARKQKSIEPLPVMMSNGKESPKGVSVSVKEKGKATSPKKNIVISKFLQQFENEFLSKPKKFFDAAPARVFLRNFKATTSIHGKDVIEILEYAIKEMNRIVPSLESSRSKNGSKRLTYEKQCIVSLVSALKVVCEKSDPPPVITNSVFVKVIKMACVKIKPFFDNYFRNIKKYTK